MSKTYFPLFRTKKARLVCIIVEQTRDYFFIIFEEILLFQMLVYSSTTVLSLSKIISNQSILPYRPSRRD